MCIIVHTPVSWSQENGYLFPVQSLWKFKGIGSLEVVQVGDDLQICNSYKKWIGKIDKEGKILWLNPSPHAIINSLHPFSASLKFSIVIHKYNIWDWENVAMETWFATNCIRTRLQKIWCNPQQIKSISSFRLIISFMIGQSFHQGDGMHRNRRAAECWQNWITCQSIQVYAEQEYGERRVFDRIEAQ